MNQENSENEPGMSAEPEQELEERKFYRAEQ